MQDCLIRFKCSDFVLRVKDLLQICYQVARSNGKEVTNCSILRQLGLYIVRNLLILPRNLVAAGLL